MVQEVSTQSWGARVVGSFFGILVGIACIVGAFAIIFWNEGNGLHTTQSLQQAEKILVTIQNTPVQPANERKVVYLTGLAAVSDELKDDVFGVTTKAIKLNRKVEMYQWQEHTETKTEKNVGGSETEVKTYVYEPVWSEEIIDSKKFKDKNGHENPTSMPYKSLYQQAKNVRVGDFQLSNGLITQINGAMPVDLSLLDIKPIKAKTNKPVAYDISGLYIGEDSTQPKIGDLRVTMSEVLPQNVSIIAQQLGTVLQAYTAPAGKPVELLAMGLVSAEQMIHHAIVENQIMMWIWRAVGFVLMFIGVALMLKPLSVLADVIPLFGTLVSVGTGVVAFAAGLILWTLAVAIAWFAVRPLLAIAMIFAAVSVSAWIVHRRRVKIK